MTTSSDTRQLLVDTAERIFADHCNKASLDAAERGEFPAALWQTLCENGFHELADATEQRARFESDQRRRIARGQSLRPVDERFLAALAHGLPDCAGVALGFDRLVMCATGHGSLDAVVAFPHERA